MRPTVKKRLVLAAAASCGLLGFVGYPAVKSVYPIKKKPTIVDDYVDLPTATADLTKDISLPEGVGTGTDVPVNISHWLLLSLLKSQKVSRREKALTDLARQRRWNDAECMEIAQALDKQDIIRLARTVDADLRLFLRPPSVGFIESTLKSNKIEKLVKTILKDLAEKLDTCSSCTNFYTNLSIRVRPDSNILAMNDLNQVDKSMLLEFRNRKKSAYNEDVIRLKAVLSNIICGEQQALSMAQSGMLVALLYFRHKYKDDVQVNSLLAQILANLSLNPSTRDYVFTEGWIQTLVEYTRSEHLELSMPAYKALANLDDETEALYGNHIYLMSPLYRELEKNVEFDVVFVHGLVGSVFKSWRQGSIALDEHGRRFTPKSFTPTTELLPTSTLDTQQDESTSKGDSMISNLISPPETPYTRCWPKDWLAKDIQGLRILAVDYPTALSNWRTDCDLNKDSLRQRAIHVMKQLEAARLGDRPIVWVAHSMGGLLVKQMLVLCDEYLKQVVIDNKEKDEEEASTFPSTFRKKELNSMSRSFIENLAKQTKGVVFYSVPHKGSNLDWIERKNLQKILMLTTEVIELQKGSPVLVDLHEKFLNFVNNQERNIKFLTFAEDSISSFGVNKVVQWKGVLVHEDSLQFDLGPIFKLNIDHAHTCKPHNRDAITYAKTLEFIKDLMPVKGEPKDEELMPFISFIL